jgi:hypothetical protein
MELTCSKKEKAWTRTYGYLNEGGDDNSMRLSPTVKPLSTRHPFAKRRGYVDRLARLQQFSKWDEIFFSDPKHAFEPVAEGWLTNQKERLAITPERCAAHRLNVSLLLLMTV